MQRRAATLAPEVHVNAGMHSGLTDRAYWDRVWRFTDEHLDHAPAVDLGDLHQRRLAARLVSRLGPGRRFLEVGAAGSPWPAHAAASGAEAWGIDFSAQGLAIAAACAARDHVAVRLVEGDLFDPACLPAGSFDVVYSGGFVEHFPDAAPLMRCLASLLAPGGVVVTGVPNLSGVNGFLQKRIDPECFARHVVHTPQSLDAVHALGGLRPVEPAQFFGVFDPGAINFSRVGERLPPAALRLIWFGLSGARRTAETLAELAGAADGGRWLAPGLVGVYSS
jgi:SAM-dependent methyltransferase